jgi:hypothetical protein
MPDERDARSLYIDLGSSQIYKPAGLVRCGMTPLPDPDRTRQEIPSEMPLYPLSRPLQRTSTSTQLLYLHEERDVCGR